MKCLIVLLACAGPLAAQTVVRGPYLQQGNESSVVVRWRTDVPVAGRVRWGLSPGGLTQAKDETSPTRDHSLTLRNLAPDTKYFYSVGTSGATHAGGDAEHYFVTSPTPGTAKKTRLWVIGDAGTKDRRQRAVRDAYTAYAGSRHTDLWLMLGDNAYMDGTDEEYQEAVFDMYKPLLAKSVVWSTFGNHDGQSADAATQTGPYFDLFTLPTRGECGGLASGTEAYYSFDYGNIHFMSLDSYDTRRSVGGAMHTWAKNDARSTPREWLIAFWHHPPYTKGSHDSDTGSPLIEMRKNFLPMLEDAGVDLVLSGHSHAYERSFLIDGHYGVSTTFTEAMKKDGGSGRDPEPYGKPGGLQPHEGTVYVVAGSSGHATGGPLNHPVMFVSLNELGSLVIDVDGPRMDVKFLRETGVVADSFTIVKEGRSPSGSDVAKPTVAVHAPTAGPTHASRAPTVTLEGTASDDVGVERVEWVNAAGGSGVASGTTAWTAVIGLHPGANAVTVTARDGAGNSAKDEITIEYDPDAAPAPARDDGEDSFGDRCGGRASGPGAWILLGPILALALGRRR